MSNHHSIQPFSQGPLFPCVIARIEIDSIVAWYELTHQGDVSYHASWDAAEDEARRVLGRAS